MSKKTILITGASKGIGFATAKYLAQQKFHILAIARSEEQLNELKKSNPRRIDYIQCDLTETGSIQKLTDTVRDQNIEISAVIHNAGLLIKKPFMELSDNDWNSLWNLNVMSAVRLLRALFPFFEKNAHFVTIGSMGGFQGSSKFPGLGAYSTVKGALSVWTESMATELAEHQISVNCLCLGAVQTKMFEDAFPGVKAPVKPAEIAEFIGDFTVNSHKFINGKIIPVAMSNP